MEPVSITNMEYSEQAPVLTLVEKKTIRFEAKEKKSYLFCKRVFDIVMSALALIILSPMLLVTAIAIYLEDRGPVFYSQKRIGKNEKLFSIYKFRSMRTDAAQIHEQLREQCKNEEVSFKLKDDPRVTRVGKFIRKCNIDELPQLINILKGEMSLVGPRPLPDYEYEEERKRYDLKYIERYSVAQGLTCIWQISNRGEIEFEDRMQMDVDYARTCSAGMDVRLIAKTISAIIMGRAGY